jgi:PadR family transcriptional regulator, regulatory protein AphA
MSSLHLTETSFVVLGMLEAAGEATPYDLKRVAQISVRNIWAVPHTQLYTECERLAKAGLLAERRETVGRRRRFYKLTSLGRKALEKWRGEPTEEFREMRDPGAVKLFFGADPKALADAQIKAHKEKLEEVHRAQKIPDMPRGMHLALEFGVNQERALIRFWSRLAAEED